MQSKATVVAPTIADATKLAEVHVASWQAAYKDLLPADILAGLSVPDRTAGWEKSLNNPQLIILKLVVGEDLIGFACATPSRDPDSTSTVVELSALYLRPNCCGKGYGKQLLAEILEKSKKQGYCSVTLWVLSTNTRAISFYESQGFYDDQLSKPYTVSGSYLTEVKRYRLEL